MKSGIPVVVKHTLLWGLPVLIVGLIAYFVSEETAFQRQEAAFQEVRQNGWALHLGESYPPCRREKIIVDQAQRVWAASACGTGIDVFDGTQWTSYTREKYYKDLAVDSLGQVWAVSVEGDALDIFNGKDWRTYLQLNQFGNLSNLPYSGMITEVETDDYGGIWILINDSHTRRSELRVLRNSVWTTYTSENSELPRDSVSIDIDPRGRVWIAADSGLIIFDGKSWQSLPVDNINLQYVVGTAFDNEGYTWVAKRCGGVLSYKEGIWETYAEDGSMADPYSGSLDPSPNCGSYWAVQDITADSRGRVWIWNEVEVRVLDKNSWTILTPENSGIAGCCIYGLAVDGSGRLWIGTQHGVSMFEGGDVKPIPQELITRRDESSKRKESMNGYSWFLPSILGILWLATYLNVLPGVLIALAIGLLSLLPFGPLILRVGMGGIPLVNPGVVATYSGILGVIIGLQIDKRRFAPGLSRLAITLAIVGVIIGLGIWFIIFVYYAID